MELHASASESFHCLVLLYLSFLFFSLPFQLIMVALNLIDPFPRFYTLVPINKKQWELERDMEKKFGVKPSTEYFQEVFSSNEYYEATVSVMRMAEHIIMRIDDFVDCADLAKWWVRVVLFDHDRFGTKPEDGDNDSRPFRFKEWPLGPGKSKAVREIKFGVVGKTIMEKA